MIFHLFETIRRSSTQRNDNISTRRIFNSNPQPIIISQRRKGQFTDPIRIFSITLFDQLVISIRQ